MNLEIKDNKNYAAEIVRISKLIPLDNCDNVVGFPIYGYQAIVGKDTQEGELAVLFTAETQLSEEYVKLNNLYRHNELNIDPDKKGYLEDNRRVKAMKFRGHTSSALVMPLSSLSYIGDFEELKEGDTFDTIDGHEICKKYVIRQNKRTTGTGTPKQAKEKLIDERLFPEHIDTENYFRNNHKLDDYDDVVITQKLHGTSGRWSHIPVKRKLTWFEKLVRRFGVNVVDTEYKYVAGSRKVIKRIDEIQNHYYGSDIWNTVLEEIKQSIPKNTIVYGEIIGWIGDKQIQKNYTYNIPQGQYELFVYRVATVNPDGYLVDYSWDAVKEFCKLAGLEHVPELWRGTHIDFRETKVHYLLDVNYYGQFAKDPEIFNEEPLELDKKSPCDEGVCIRREGIQPFILKAKSPMFLTAESKELDTGEADIESLESDSNEDEI